MSTSFKDRNLLAVIGDEVRYQAPIRVSAVLTQIFVKGFYHWPVTCWYRARKRAPEEKLLSC